MRKSERPPRWCQSTWVKKRASTFCVRSLFSVMKRCDCSPQLKRKRCRPATTITEGVIPAVPAPTTCT
jgi:hypothetical protein